MALSKFHFDKNKNPYDNATTQAVIDQWVRDGAPDPDNSGDPTKKIKVSKIGAQAEMARKYMKLNMSEALVDFMVYGNDHA